ncbi:eCIS core domain-containing protein [Geodermatophilus sp. URMC 62]|uniref:eCIS core domain-containing protein n=1 Tax=Geodermatophilus sp. URMC 62 TaxID=3423414 RepID=UPI00406CF0CE
MGDRLTLITRPSGTPAARSRACTAPPRDRREHRAPALDRTPAGRVQPRLLVGPADDPFEREAERTADAVTFGSRAPASSVFAAQPVAGGLLRAAQRAIGKGEPPTKEDDERDEKARRTPSGTTGPHVAPAGIEAGIASLSHGGTQLAPGVRSLFEPRFGFDFSEVRVHVGPEAAGAARGLGARAFTVGDHVFFGAGEYQPQTPAGQHLIAHELTHTIQQKSGAARAARLLTAPRRVQRLFEDTKAAISGQIHDFLVEDFPPWHLITLIIGYDPIRDVPVTGTTRDWIRAALELVPDGPALFDKLDKEGQLDAVAKWWDLEVATLDLTHKGLTALVDRAWDAVGVSDVLDPLAAWNEKLKPIFAPVVARVWTFVGAVGVKVLHVLKDLVLREVGAWAKKQKGYPLLTMVLGRDPVTGEEVRPTLKGIIFAVLDLVDGGDKIKENLEKSKAVEKAATWFTGEVKKLQLTWEGIRLLFTQAWDAFRVADLLAPALLLEKMWAVFGPTVLRLLTFLVAVGRKVLEFVFEGAMLIAGPIGLQIVGIVRKIGATFARIVEDPVAFVGHLVAAVKKGVQQFARNIGEHLKTGLVNWLVGTLEGAGLVLPRVWDLRGILDLVLQVLDVTYAKLRVKLVKVLGEKTVSMLEAAFAYLKTLVTEGPAAAWKEIVAAIDSLWDMVIGGIRDWAVTRIVTAAVTKLITMFNPAGAVIQAIIATYDTVAFFIERAKQIAAFVAAVVDSIANIAQGKTAQAANWVEQAMARTIPVILGFLARFIGLGDVSGAVKKVITGIQDKMDKGIDAAIAWIVAQAKSLVGSVKGAAGTLLEWWRARARFRTTDGEQHDLVFQGEEKNADLVVRTSPRTMAVFFAEWAAGAKATKDPAKKEAQKQALADARTQYGIVKGLQDQLAVKPTKGVIDPTRQTKADSLSTELQRLGELLAKHDLGPTTPFPPALFPPFVAGVLAPSFKSKFLTKQVLDTGTPTKDSVSQRPKSWDVVVAAGLSKGSKWVRMHLLTAALGGQAVDSNLVPALGVETNQVFDRKIENEAYKALAGTGPEPEVMLWYDVKVRFHAPSATHGIGFPSYISMEWGGYEEKSGAWAEKPPSAKRTYTQSPGLPDLSGSLAPAKINFAGRGELSRVFGITVLPARRITEIRSKDGPFADADDFLKRVAEDYNDALAKNITSTARDPALVSYSLVP